ncbi:class I SAM-dependent methyltransferase [Streptomyces sp. NPDC008313]|uniref:class I SAM-dependent methyltransferase n=1 Tax=Streptomyces sp. NPDC008313 TaxID=3364826 RepID=UPI0036EBD1D2
MADETGLQLRGSAPERYEEYVAPLMAPFVEAVVDAVDLFPGAAVLDLACGTGFAARAAAARVGPAGRVSGADVNDGMLRVAAANAPRMYPDIEFTAAPADKLPYPDATFDRVVCQQGAQFFTDLDAAFAEAARVTRPGGRLAATAWADMRRSPYFEVQYRALTDHAGQETAADYAKAFSCTADRLTAALGAAGFHDVTAYEVTFGIALPPLPGFAPGHLSALPWGQAVLDTGGPDALARAAADIREHLADRTGPDGVTTLPFTAVLVTGAR